MSIRIHKLLLGVALGLAAPLAAQESGPTEAVVQAIKPGPHAEAVMLTAAAFVGDFSSRGEWFAMPFKGLEPRLLSRTTLPFSYENGAVLSLVTKLPPGRRSADVRLLEQPLAKRGSELNLSLAQKLRGSVATDADSIACDPGMVNCRGTLGVMVGLGNPVVHGDSAVVLFSLHVRGGNREDGIAGAEARFALFLHRADSAWKPIRVAEAGLNRLGMAWQLDQPAPAIKMIRRPGGS